jgi:hypothetical protein
LRTSNVIYDSIIISTLLTSITSNPEENLSIS